MKKALMMLVMSLSALTLTNVATAAPHFEHDSRADHHDNGKKSREFRDYNSDQNADKRRMREERGVKRLQQIKWQPGYVMPQHYRSSGYKVGFKEHNLPRPERKQQWYKVNNDFILVDSDSNSIVRIAN